MEGESQGATEGMLGPGGTAPYTENTGNQTSILDPGAEAGTPPPAPGLQDTTGGARPNQPPVAGGLPPSAAAAGTPPPAPSKHLSTFDQILSAMGAKPHPNYVVDAQGKLQRAPDPPMTTHQRLGMVLAAAITGFAAGTEEHGPGAGLRSVGAGARATINQNMGQDQQAREKAVDDWKRQQAQQSQATEGQLKQAQIFETNQRAALFSRQAENADEETRQHYVESSAPMIQAARLAEVKGQSALKREHMTQDQLLQEHSQPGARHGTTNVYVPDGEVAAVDPKSGKPITNADGSPRMEYTYAEIDPAAPIELDAATLDEAVKNGYPVPGYTPGTVSTLSMPISAAANLVHYNQGIQNLKSLVTNINSTLGLKDKSALDPQAIIASNPQVATAFAQMAGHFDGRPSELPAALAAMQKDPKLAPYARTIVSAIGGNKLDEFTETVKAQNDAAKEAAKEAAKLPYEVAKEDRLNANRDARDDKKAHAKDSDLMIAGIPGQDDTQVMRKGDVPEGWTAYGLKNPDQLAATIRRTNDVQTKINQLANFVKNGGMEHIQAGLVGDAVADINKEFKVGMMGTELPTARINAVLDQENYKSMNEPSRQFIRAYGFAREAMTQLPALQSYGKSNRMNDTQLRAAMQLLPDHRMAGNTQAALDQMIQLQGVLDPLRKLPKGLPGATILPSWNEAQPANNAAPGAAGGAAPDPFAAFGGKKRPAATTSATASQ